MRVHRKKEIAERAERTPAGACRKPEDLLSLNHPNYKHSIRKDTKRIVFGKHGSFWLYRKYQVTLTRESYVPYRAKSPSGGCALFLAELIGDRTDRTGKEINLWKSDSSAAS